MQDYPAISWAVGIVVPEGASLVGGDGLSWEDAANVTATIELANISRPDLPVYAVLSVMTADRTVLQVAFGIPAGGSHWLVYADLVTNVGSGPPTYQQILNASGPQALPGDPVSISIFRPQSGPWGLRVVDSRTGASLIKSFPSGVSFSLKAGDQEVFALESYSRSLSTFEDMGNLTLKSLRIDGYRVSGGYYAYRDWDPTHNPLFIVGSSGSSPPQFISLQRNDDGSFVWKYASPWSSNDLGNPGLAVAGSTVVLLLGSLIVVASVIALTRIATRRRHVQGGDGGATRAIGVKSQR